MGIVKAGVLAEVNSRCVIVSNKVLDKITVCLPREIPIAQGDKLHLKANRKLASGARVTNGELVTVKSASADGIIELTDGRILDKSFREFLPGYAVTSYGYRARRWITFCSPIPPSRPQPTRNNGMSPFRAGGAASAFSRRTRSNCVRICRVPVTDRWH